MHMHTELISPLKTLEGRWMTVPFLQAPQTTLPLMDCQPLSLQAPDCAGWCKSSASGENLALGSQPVDICDLPFFQLGQASHSE